MRNNFKNLTGAEIIFKIFNKKKVTNIFTYTGGASMAVIDQLNFNKNIKHFTNTHEQSAGHAATAYARISGKPGICLMTSGPGVTNMITPLTDATNDSTPLILLTGNVPLKMIGTNAFQECPATDITKPITKWSHLIKNIVDLPDVIESAFRISNTGKKGSVHIDIPKCILNTKYPYDYIKQRDHFNNNIRISEEKESKIRIVSLNTNSDSKEKFKLQNIYSNIYMTQFRSKDRYSNSNILQIMSLLNNCQKPLIIAGQGCNDYSLLLRAFAIRGNIPVTTTIHAQGVFDENHYLSLEFLGMHGSPAANYAVQEADLIIALGTRFDDRTTGNIEKYAPNAFRAYKRNEGGIVHVNINETEINKVIKTHYNFNMDCGKFLSSVVPFCRAREQWLKQINNWKKQYPFIYDKEDKIKTQDVICSINNFLEQSKLDNYIITTGVGNHQMMACQYIKWKYPKSFVTSGSLGVMGVGLPFAIGSQIADPTKLVIDIDGDGSFNHTLSELKTVMNYKLPIKIAIMNDTCFSMVNAWEKLFFEERHVATDLVKNPDYVKIAESYGIKGIYCENKSDLKDKIEQFLMYDKSILCEFKVKKDLCFPLVPPGAALDEMILYDKDNLNNIKVDEFPPS